MTELEFYRGIARLNAWLDESNEPGPHEDATRVLKCAEEAGEAASAYIRHVQQNPRKRDVETPLRELLDELADAANAAVCVIQHFTRDARLTRDVVNERLHATLRRAGLEVSE